MINKRFLSTSVSLHFIIEFPLSLPLCLTHQNLNKDTTMRAANGKAIPAMTVFCHALRFFRDHALQEITDQSDTKITNEDVKWVITVPAIWKAPAKQFMRQAAYIVSITINCDMI